MKNNFIPKRLKWTLHWNILLLKTLLVSSSSRAFWRLKKRGKFKLQYFISFSFQGVFIEKSSKLYAKVTLLENNKEVASKKVLCSSNKKIYDFSKELQFKLHRKHPENCKIIVQFYGDNIYDNRYFSDKKVSELVLGLDKEESAISHWKHMTEKPEDRIFMWHTLF